LQYCTAIRVIWRWRWLTLILSSTDVHWTVYGVRILIFSPHLALHGFLTIKIKVNLSYSNGLPMRWILWGWEQSRQWGQRRDCSSWGIGIIIETWRLREECGRSNFGCRPRSYACRPCCGPPIDDVPTFFILWKMG
jgi:hypothetical protein